MSTQPPTHITGGCLCGAVRYRIDFPSNPDFKANSSICLCTQCRKQSGALAVHFINTPLSSLTWQSGCLDQIPEVNRITSVDYSSPSSTSSSDGRPKELRAFNATPGNNRLLCSACGSMMAWYGANDPEPQTIEICAGTVDEEWLLGKKIDRGDFEDNGFGNWLIDPQAYVVWAVNDIKGVTDGIGSKKGENGQRWKFNSSRGLKVKV